MSIAVAESETHLFKVKPTCIDLYVLQNYFGVMVDVTASLMIPHMEPSTKLPAHKYLPSETSSSDERLQLLQTGLVSS